MTRSTYPANIIAKRYTSMSKLGAGGMGSVFRVVDRLTGNHVALKQVAVKTSALHMQDDLSMHVALSHEFQTLAALRHPNVIGVLDYGFENLADGLQPFFTMALVEGGRTLREASLNRPFDEKIKLLVQVLQALVYVHRQNIIHRDLKPENVLVTPDDVVKMLDFGLATSFGETNSGELVGTVYYMAPELFLGHAPSKASDLYAVGVMTYEMLVGQHPYDADNNFKLIQNMQTSEPNFDLVDEVFKSHYADEKTSTASTSSEEVTTDVVGGKSTILLTQVEQSQANELIRSNPISYTNSLSYVLRRLLSKDPAYRYNDAQETLHDLSQIIGIDLNTSMLGLQDSFLHAARFVERDVELNRLSNALAQARMGQTSLWFIGGESGVGKSRLLDEFRTAAMIQGALVLRGQAEVDGANPYQIWREPLRRLLLTIDPSALATVDLSVLKQLVPDLDSLLNLTVPDAPLLTGVDGEQRLNTAVLNLFKSYFQFNDPPLLIILEDVHWATKALDLVTLLMSSSSTHPMMLVGSFRDDEAPELLSQFPQSQLLVLSRLSEDAIRMLSESMLGESGKSRHIVNLLQQESEGNVFFLTEIIHALAEEAGDLAQVGKTTLPARLFTGGMKQIVQRRLDRVPQVFRPLLHLAAAAGRQLDLRLLAQVAGEVDFEMWITTCANATVIVLRDERWQFAHDKLREHILNSFTDEEVTALHEQLGTAFEVVYANELEQHAAALAYHWSFTQNQAKKVRFSMLAGEAAMKISAFADAQSHFVQALDSLSVTSATRGERSTVLTRLGDVAVTLGRYDTGSAYLDEAVALAREINDSKPLAKALQTSAWIHLRQGAMEQAQATLEEALSIASIGGHHEETMLASYLTSVLHVIKGQYADAQRSANAALPLAIATADRAHEADIRNVLGAIEEGLGNPLAAYTQLNTAYTIAKEIGYRYLMANALGNMARTAYFQGKHEQSLRQAEEVLQLFREMGSIYPEAIMLYFIGFNKIALDQASAAWKDLVASLKISRQIGATPMILITLTGVVRLYLKIGQPEQAAELLSFVIHHPDSKQDVDVMRDAEPLREAMERQTEAWERGKTLLLESVVADLIARHE